MNKEDYVSLEVAKLMQDKGFREPCYATYTMEFNDKFDLWIGVSGKTEFEYLSRIPSKGVQLQYLAPTLYESQKWLRKEHDIHIDVGMCGDYSTDTDGNKVGEWEFWTFDMYYTTNFINHIYDCKGEYDTYEEALNAGILEALKLI